ncbi:MAG TPA: TonB-dependent receptor [Longimicrobium sp.]|nr:TonB-dependent receptor [Longimicrobium sp.]
MPFKMIHLARPLALAAAAVLSLARPSHAQEPARVTVRVTAEDAPVAEARVAAGAVRETTDSAGVALLRLTTGPHRVVVTKDGYARAVLAVTVAGDTTLAVVLEEAEEDEHEVEVEELVVTATRSEQRIEDVPVRVEVLSREEVEEKMLMTPGDIAMMLNETSGLRVQSTSPSLGGATVRVQGLRGRYTQLLSDGLPLYGGQSGALGLLQIPPMDLGQVEVIKGAASALYGGSALGGVVNLVSRRPADDRELLLNATTLGGADAVFWQSRKIGERWGYTLLASGHRQEDADVDDDRWADLPGYRRAVLRPRLFWDDGAGRSLFATVGATAEEREGGGLVPGGEYPEALRTGRIDVGGVGRTLVGGGALLSVRASAMAQRHRHTFGPTLERDLHGTAFAETSLGRTRGAHTWVLGGALQYERYDARDVSGWDYTYVIPSLFAQDEVALSDALSLLASGRVDAHSEYGAFFNPRLSLLVRPAEGWSVRASAGTGYHAPTPFTEETEAIGLAPLVLSGELEAERAWTASLDVGRALGAVEVNATLFASSIDDALALRPAPTDGITLVNVDGRTRTHGTELLARWHAGPWHATATHTWIRATEPHGAGRREVPLTPRHQAGVVGMWEAEGEGRIGLELYYTGRQALEDNPYRARSRPFFIVGLLAERRFGRARVFVNAENLLDARQTRWDRLVLPARSPEGRWTTDLWAPAEGRVVNAGVRLEL